MLEILFNICAFITGIVWLVMKITSPVGKTAIELVARLVGMLLILGAVYHFCGVPFQIHK